MAYYTGTCSDWTYTPTSANQYHRMRTTLYGIDSMQARHRCEKGMREIWGHLHGMLGMWISLRGDHIDSLSHGGGSRRSQR